VSNPLREKDEGLQHRLKYPIIVIDTPRGICHLWPPPEKRHRKRLALQEPRALFVNPLFFGAAKGW
jgi:hypothetical protein